MGSMCPRLMQEGRAPPSSAPFRLRGTRHRSQNYANTPQPHCGDIRPALSCPHTRRA